MPRFYDISGITEDALGNVNINGDARIRWWSYKGGAELSRRHTADIALLLSQGG